MDSVATTNNGLFEFMLFGRAWIANTFAHKLPEGLI
jgi:hypothetical protein